VRKKQRIFIGAWAIGFVSAKLEGVELVEAGLLLDFIVFGEGGGEMLYHLTFGNLYYYRHRELERG